MGKQYEQITSKIMKKHSMYNLHYQSNTNQNTYHSLPTRSEYDLFNNKSTQCW